MRTIRCGASHGAVGVLLFDYFLPRVRRQKNFCQDGGKFYWNSVADLLCYLDIGTAKYEGIVERLQACGLAYSNWTIRLRMEVASLLGLIEFSSNRRRRFRPVHPAENVGAADFLLQPTLWRKVRATPDEVESVATGRNKFVAFD